MKIYSNVCSDMMPFFIFVFVILLLNLLLHHIEFHCTPCNKLDACQWKQFYGTPKSLLIEKEEMNSQVLPMRTPTFHIKCFTVAVAVICGSCAKFPTPLSLC